MKVTVRLCYSLNNYKEQLLTLEFTETYLLFQMKTISTQLNEKLKEDENLSINLK